MLPSASNNGFGDFAEQSLQILTNYDRLNGIKDTTKIKNR